MKKKINGKKMVVMVLSSLFFLLLFAPPLLSRTVTQITPTVTITEEYTDNYLKSDTSKQQEYITSLGLGFSMGFLQKKSKIYLAYDPSYKVYKYQSDNDKLLHQASLDGTFTPTKHTTISANLFYSGNDSTDTGETWQNSATLSGESQITKNTILSFSESYSQNFDQQLRTGTYKEHDVNTTSVGITRQFGKRDKLGGTFSYSFDDFDNFDADEYTKYSPSGFITYWITPQNGLDMNLAYENTEFDNSSDDIKTYSGHIKYIKKFTKHFNGYVKYRHSYSDRDSGDHTIYHPSLGFDWAITEDSGISLGIGALINEWENNNDDSTDPFLDISAYKVFNFSRRGSLSVTGSSGYSESGGEAASLGYTTYYQAGIQYAYQLQKRLSSSLFGTYRLDQFHEPAVDRTDNSISLGGNLSWNPLKWLWFDFSYTFTDYNTDGTLRDDYQENKVTFSIRLIPSRPFKPEFSPSRQSLETQLFND